MIEILSPHVANLIAAGEVVERPASVVKELLENAVDAGASAVTVELKRGGISMLRVTDDGEGMDAEDAVRAFMRHATSKLKTAEDLQAVATLGFRGEALAAVAAVSRVELLTRKRGTENGFSLALESGVVTSQSAAGCPEGTTIVVRDLFFNTPARQKFLKKDHTESAAAQEAVIRAALSRPGLSVRLIKDGVQTLQTPGDGDLKNALYCVFGGDFVKPLLAIPEIEGEIRVSGYIGSPQVVRSSRLMQYFFVEGRPVRSRTLYAAVEEAYSNELMSGRFPICVLHVNMPLDTFDINVHPAKSEVKFQNERAVFEAVYRACRETLQNTPPVHAVRFSFRDAAGKEIRITDASAPMIYREAIRSAPSAPELINEPLKTEHKNTQTALRGTETASAPIREPLHPKTPPYNIFISENNSESQLNEPLVPSWRLVGEALSGYLLVETPDCLWLIDKHAAHERLLFNRLKAGERPFFSQQLIVPRTVVLNAVERDVLLDEREFLEAAGFELDAFGPNTVAVRAAPGDIDESEIPALLSEVASLLRDKRRPDLRDEALRSIACKAAVKLGRSSAHADMEYLAELVMQTPDLRHCPHGRPVAVRLTRSELARQFGR